MSEIGGSPGVALKRWITKVDDLLNPRRSWGKGAGADADYDDFIRYNTMFKERSPFEWLAGVFLPEVYEIHIDQHASPTKSSEFILFAEAALAELRVMKGCRPFARAAISKALVNARKGLVRRKNAVSADQAEFDWYREYCLLHVCGFKWDLVSVVDASKLLRQREQAVDKRPAPRSQRAARIENNKSR